VIAILYSTPMPTDQVQPLLRFVLLGQRAGQVVA
jgi:hypothetical protein